MTSLAMFWDRLQSHDWFYEYSDDWRVVQRGESDRRRLRGMAAESDAHERLYKAWADHIIRNGPRPARPKDEP